MPRSINDLRKDSTSTSIFLSVYVGINFLSKTTINRFHRYHVHASVPSIFVYVPSIRIHLSYSSIDRPVLNQTFALILIMLHDFFSANGCKSLDRCISETRL